MEILLHLDRYMASLKINKKASQSLIYDPIRKKDIILQPEEWVRQLFIQYLIIEKKISPKLMAIEKGHHLHGLQKRSDLILYNQHGIACAIVECKSHKHNLNQDVLDQASRYNLKWKLPYVIITNGLSCIVALVDHQEKSFHFMDEVPDMKMLNEIT